LIRRKLDFKTSKHHFFSRIGLKGEDSSNGGVVLKEGEWYDAFEIKNSEIRDSESDTYASIGFWRDDVCYKQLDIQRPFIFTKHV
jgi:hypothetical protein